MSSKGHAGFGPWGDGIDNAMSIETPGYDPYAWVHIKPGTSQTPPLLIEPGKTTVTTNRVGQILFDGTNLYLTDWTLTPKAVLMVGKSNSGNSLTNIPISAIATNGVAPVVTNNVYCKIPWFTNSGGVTVYMLGFTNGP